MSHSLIVNHFCVLQTVVANKWLNVTIEGVTDIKHQRDEPGDLSYH